MYIQQKISSLKTMTDLMVSDQWGGGGGGGLHLQNFTFHADTKTLKFRPLMVKSYLFCVKSIFGGGGGGRSVARTHTQFVCIFIRRGSEGVCVFALPVKTVRVTV